MLQSSAPLQEKYASENFICESYYTVQSAVYHSFSPKNIWYLLSFAVSEKRILHVETMQFGGILGQHFIKLLDKTVAFVSCGKRVISQMNHQKKEYVIYFMIPWGRISNTMRCRQAFMLEE